MHTNAFFVDKRYRFILYYYGMEQQRKTGKLNLLGSGLAFLITAYLTVIYILLMMGSIPGCLAYEITTDYAGHFVLRFVVVVLVYVCCAVNLMTIPSYLVMKTKGLEWENNRRRIFGAASLISSAVMFVLVIMFTVASGSVFESDMATPFATPYRIIEIVLTVIQIAAVLLTLIYSVNNDALRVLKKKYNKI